MNRQDGQEGSLILYAIFALAIVSLVGGTVYTYNHAIKEAEKYKNLYNEEQALRIAAEGALQIQKELDRQKSITLRLEMDEQYKNERDAERRSQEASADIIAGTMERDADKYTDFTERVMEKNFELIECKSDYRKMREDDACIGHVR